jgi:hypothetical protein
MVSSLMEQGLQESDRLADARVPRQFAIQKASVHGHLD